MARGRPWVAALVAVLILALSGTAIYLVFFRTSTSVGAGNQAAALTVFTGTVEETRAGTTTSVPAAHGRPAASGRPGRDRRRDQGRGHLSGPLDHAARLEFRLRDNDARPRG